MSYTFSYIKPRAVVRKKIGEILKMIEEAGFTICALKKTRLTREQAAAFYAEHEGKEFFERLMSHSTSGPVVAMVLEREGDVVAEFRKFIGNTDPEKAEKGSIRALFGESITANAIHGSDSEASVKRESAFFFSTLERF